MYICFVKISFVLFEKFIATNLHEPKRGLPSIFLKYYVKDMSCKFKYIYTFTLTFRYINIKYMRIAFLCLR